MRPVGFLFEFFFADSVLVVVVGVSSVQVASVNTCPNGLMVKVAP